MLLMTTSGRRLILLQLIHLLKSIRRPSNTARGKAFVNEPADPIIRSVIKISVL
jgi:hypothetical protein